MARGLGALLEDLEHSGPEDLGVPVRAVAMLSRDLGELFSGAGDPLALRRRRAAAARLARRALSLATEVHGVVGDRPDAARAWSWNARELGRRLDDTDPPAGDPAACARALGRVADLAVALPEVSDDDEDDWQAEMIAFADEGALRELHDACLDLAATALTLATTP